MYCVHCAESTSGRTHVCEDCGASLCDATDCFGVTLLMAACGKGDARAARNLLEAGASVDATRIDMGDDLGTTALMACIRGHRAWRTCDIDCIDVLLRHGADPLLRDNLGDPGCSAIDRMHEKIAWYRGYLVRGPATSSHKAEAETTLSMLEVALDRLLRGRPVWRRLRAVYLWTTLVRPACLAWRLRAAERAYAPDGEGFASVMRGPQAVAYAKRQRLNESVQ